jgi:ring-1,2-phenylacetyl-CoA epoxidase subunit PaaC
MMHFWEAAKGSFDPTIKGIAGKAVKENAYHVRHASEWVIRLGDGTDESAGRTADAVTYLAPYMGELFEDDAVVQALAANGTLPLPSTLKEGWIADMAFVMGKARLEMPDLSFNHSGGRQGVHTEEMGHLLAELQYMQRTYPGMEW